MKSVYTNPNLEILKLHTKEDILTPSQEKPDPTVPDIGVEDEGDF